MYRNEACYARAVGSCEKGVLVVPRCRIAYLFEPRAERLAGQADMRGANACLLQGQVTDAELSACASLPACSVAVAHARGALLKGAAKGHAGWMCGLKWHDCAYIVCDVR